MPQTHKLALLDDYQKVALKMADWDRLKKRGVEITVFHEPFSSVDDAAKKLAPFDMLVLLRERTAFPKALIDKLSNLKFMVLTGARASSLDDKAAAERGIRNGERVWLLTPTGARLNVQAMVTERVGPDTVWMPFHFSGRWQGADMLAYYPAGAAPVVRGEAVNTATTYGYDSVTMMQETKTTICNIQKAA